MDGLRPVYEGLTAHLGDDGMYLLGKESLGPHKLDVGQEGKGTQQFGRVLPQLVGKLLQDADNLAPFLSLEFADAVIGLHDLSRFDIDRLARGRLVMHDTPQLPFHGRSHGDDETAVTQRGGGIRIDQSLALGRLEDMVQGATDAALQAVQFVPYLEECTAGIVLYLAELVENLLDASRHRAEGEDTVGQTHQGGVGGKTPSLIGFPAYDVDEGMEGVEGAFQVPHLLFFDEGTLDADALDGGTEIKEFHLRHTVLSFEEVHEFACLFQGSVQYVEVGLECHLLDEFLTHGAGTMT